MIQIRNAMLSGLLTPDLLKNRGEAYWMPYHVAVPVYNAAKWPVLLVTTGAAPVTINLPVVAVQLAKVYAIKKIDAGVGTVDITVAGGADLIDGAPVYQLVAQYEAIIIVSDGITDWWIISNI